VVFPNCQTCNGNGTGCDNCSPSYTWNNINKQCEIEYSYSSGEEAVASVATSSTRVLSQGGQYISIIVVLMNFDISGTIFKVIQIINLFDKLRLMNIRLNGLLGKFLDSIAEMFNTNLIQKDDYHLTAKPRTDRFQETKTQVIAYRRKVDKMVFLTFGLLIDLFIVIWNWKSPLRSDMPLTKLEKRGNIVKRLLKLNQVFLLMAAIDVFFYCGHQLLH
jgi:hypothetical protein